MSVRVRATVNVTEEREVEVVVPVSGPDDVGTAEVVEAIERAHPFTGFYVTDYEVLDGSDG